MSKLIINFKYNVSIRIRLVKALFSNNARHLEVTIKISHQFRGGKSQNRDLNPINVQKLLTFYPHIHAHLAFASVCPEVVGDKGEIAVF